MDLPFTDAPAQSPGHLSGKTLFAAVAALLLLHVFLAVGSKLRESTTSDELVHVTGGLSYWENHDYRLQPENGVLPQRWAALPSWVMGTRFPELKNNIYWQYSDVWVVGHMLFYESGQNHFPRLMAARAMIALFSAATGLAVFLWSRRLFGSAGGLASLFFFVFCPTFLAHGALATSDACMAFFFLATLSAWWWHLHDTRWVALGVSATVFGLALVAKYSAGSLLPVMVATATIKWLRDEVSLPPGTRQWLRWRNFLSLGISLAVHAAVGAIIIWAFYGFRYTAFNPSLPPALQFIKSWPEFEASLGRTGRLFHLARQWQVLPEAYLYGFAYVLETIKMRGAFLDGKYSVTGWPSFFLWAFFYKSTVAELVGCILTVALFLRALALRRAAILLRLYEFSPLILLFAVYWAGSITSHLNIGHRHILPIYPLIFITFGWIGNWLKSGRRIVILSAALLIGGQAWTASTTFPHYIAYFNEIVGGPGQGRNHLVDSSLDWGQDLPGLQQWLSQPSHREEVYLSYFGTGEPEYYNIHAHRLAFLNSFKFPTGYEKLGPGLYCISATILSEVYGPGHGSWDIMLEKEYQILRGLEPLFAEYTTNAARRRELEVHVSAARWQEVLKRFDVLRLARLSQYLRRLEPLADVGHSILIFRLSASEVKQATESDAHTWAALVAGRIADKYQANRP